ncbi:hypothetical protein Pcinc_018898 [Petrolisthes cinctipes]|uniref:Uncharacterized protein n=1 Tax=Petrolisthes cinctipes TaxID=88211 RepID=A0AAE1FMS1_PETCI|nr:hypothetical protein Pcinc_018898 [Petrolisthes cinctipes]
MPTLIQRSTTMMPTLRDSCKPLQWSGPSPGALLPLAKAMKRTLGLSSPIQTLDTPPSTPTSPSIIRVQVWKWTRQQLTCGIQKQVVASDIRLLSLGKEATDKENRTKQYGQRRWVTCATSACYHRVRRQLIRKTGQSNKEVGQHSYCQQELGTQYGTSRTTTVQPGGSSTPTTPVREQKYMPEKLSTQIMHSLSTHRTTTKSSTGLIQS